MKLNVALFFAGLFGALAALFILISFGTDYWLLTVETQCTPKTNLSHTNKPMDSSVGQSGAKVNTSVFYHGGFFWSCMNERPAEESSYLDLWFLVRPFSKSCEPAYRCPFPVHFKTQNATTEDNALIYRGFWSAFMLLGVTSVILGGFIIICAAPFSGHCLYKAGGGLFLIAGFSMLLATVLFVIWLELSGMVNSYVNYKSEFCPEFQLNKIYGFSFLFAPVGLFFSLLSGLLFVVIGRALKSK